MAVGLGVRVGVGVTVGELVGSGVRVSVGVFVAFCGVTVEVSIHNPNG